MTQDVLLSSNGEAEAPERSSRQRPTKVLPTDRIQFKKQLDLLRAYAAASGPSGKAVSNTDVAGIVKMNASTVSIANAFFSEMKFLLRVDGKYLPSPEVISYARAIEWSPDTASHKLAPLIEESWFGQALIPKLSFRSLDEDEAIQTLAEEASASKDYRNQLRILLDYMEAAGVVQRDGNMIKLARPNGAAAVIEKPAPSAQPSETAAGPSGGRAAVATVFTTPTEGTVQFHVSVRVDMAEFATWPPEQIKAFFGGIAQVLAAKAAIEKDSGAG